MMYLLDFGWVLCYNTRRFKGEEELFNKTTKTKTIKGENDANRRNRGS